MKYQMITLNFFQGVINLPIPKRVAETNKSDSDDSFHSMEETVELAPHRNQHDSYIRSHVPNEVIFPPTGGQLIPQPSKSVSTSKLLPNILAIPDFDKRKSKVEINIITLHEEMEDLELRINAIIAENVTFYEDNEFQTLNRKKGVLLREKLALEKFLQQMNEELDSQTEEFNNMGGNLQNSNIQGHSNYGAFSKRALPLAHAFPNPTDSSGDARNLQSSVAIGRVLVPPDVSSSSQSPTTVPDVLPEDEKITMQNRDDMKMVKGIYSKPKEPMRVATLPTESGEGWICQHCTIHNKQGMKVCSMCHKTTGYPENANADTVPAHGQGASDGPVMNRIEKAQDQVIVFQHTIYSLCGY